MVHRHHRKKPWIFKESTWIRILDKAMYPVGLLGPIMTLPQLYQIWVIQEVAGVSLITWSSWLVIAFFWLAYGITHKAWPIVATYICWIAIELGVVVGVVLYN